MLLTYTRAMIRFSASTYTTESHAELTSRIFHANQTSIVNSEMFASVFFSRNFAYTKLCENKILAKWRITLSFTDIGKSCSSCEFLASQICLLTLFAKIKFSRKFPLNSMCLDLSVIIKGEAGTIKHVNATPPHPHPLVFLLLTVPRRFLLYFLCSMFDFVMVSCQFLAAL